MTRRGGALPLSGLRPSATSFAGPVITLPATAGPLALFWTKYFPATKRGAQRHPPHCRPRLHFAPMSTGNEPKTAPRHRHTGAKFWPRRHRKNATRWKSGVSPQTKRSEARRVGKECAVRVDLGCRRIIKKKNRNKKTKEHRN